MSCGIYKITNKVNGHSYIGQSIDIERRWSQHKRFPVKDSKYPLYQAFYKYGLDNFIFEIIELCQPEDLNKRETYYISLFNTYNNGYNQTLGGEGSNGCQIKLSNEDILSIYDLLKESDLSQNDIAKLFLVGPDTISEINQGKTRRIFGFNYPIRNNHTSSICPICGNKMSRGASKCRKCQNKSLQVTERPSREELKTLIRETSFLEIGRKYNVTDNTIRKWCIAQNLPHKKTDIKKITDEDWINI